MKYLADDLLRRIRRRSDEVKEEFGKRDGRVLGRSQRKRKKRA